MNEITIAKVAHPMLFSNGYAQMLPVKKYICLSSAMVWILHYITAAGIRVKISS